MLRKRNFFISNGKIISRKLILKIKIKALSSLYYIQENNGTSLEATSIYNKQNPNII